MNVIKYFVQSVFYRSCNNSYSMILFYYIIIFLFDWLRAQSFTLLHYHRLQENNWDWNTRSFYGQPAIMLDVFSTPRCTNYVQKSQKIVSKTWSNLLFLTILDWQALLGSPKSAGTYFGIILESSEIVNFGWKFLPWLAWNIVSRTIWQDSASHYY